jgi:hypothetical protein
VVERDDLIARARWMLRNGMRPNHNWTPCDDKYSNTRQCDLCPWDSPFKLLAWAHPIIIEEDAF